MTAVQEKLAGILEGLHECANDDRWRFSHRWAHWILRYLSPQALLKWFTSRTTEALWIGSDIGSFTDAQRQEFKVNRARHKDVAGAYTIMYGPHTGDRGDYAGETINLWRRHCEHLRSIEDKVNSKHYRDVQDHVDSVMMPVTIVNTATAHQEFIDLVDADKLVSSSALDKLRYAKTTDIVKGILRLDELVIMHLFDTVTFPYRHEAAMAQYVEMASSPVFPLNSCPESSVHSASNGNVLIDDASEDLPDSHVFDVLEQHGRFV